VKFIDEHAGRRVDDGLRWGVESICALLSEHGASISPSTYTTPGLALRVLKTNGTSDS
jgi:hypothetical protein